jgi:hypothetical protein
MNVSAAVPEARIALELPERVESLTLRIVSLSNPAMQAFVLRVSLVAVQDGRTAEVELGRVSPFPLDQPGAFSLPLSDPADRLLEATNGHVDLVVELLPADAARPIQPPLDVQLEARPAGG